MSAKQVLTVEDLAAYFLIRQVLKQNLTRCLFWCRGLMVNSSKDTM